MYSHAQQKILELKKQGVYAALFEGAWSEQSFVFELGTRMEEGEVLTAVDSAQGQCGYITYEGDECFYKINQIYRFASQAYVVQKKITQATSISPHESFSQYSRKIQQILEYICAGETYQVNYSIPFQIDASDRDPFEVYCELFRINPSPYACYFDTPDGALISNSPECLMKIDSTGRIRTIPIKGTVAAEEPDEKLLNSEKNKAELAMIVDLERNDLGKVCTVGSVQVVDHRKIENYSHVKHTVSVVEGRLEQNKTWRDALAALFPGGSITGCPKIRTMEIIKKLEVGKRGIYCGSAGFVLNSRHPDTVFNILIRSLWYDKKSNTFAFRSGGGIVADSRADDEYAELLHKAGAILSVLQ